MGDRGVKGRQGVLLPQFVVHSGLSWSRVYAMGRGMMHQGCGGDGEVGRGELLTGPRMGSARRGWCSCWRARQAAQAEAAYLMHQGECLRKVLLPDAGWCRVCVSPDMVCLHFLSHPVHHRCLVKPVRQHRACTPPVDHTAERDDERGRDPGAEGRVLRVALPLVCTTCLLGVNDGCVRWWKVTKTHVRGEIARQRRRTACRRMSECVRV
jgi:hypothetical protein